MIRPHVLLMTKREEEQMAHPKVPITRVEMGWLFPMSPADFANPKSDTLGVKSYSSKMLLALKSR
jgi:hypothetical protein